MKFKKIDTVVKYDNCNISQFYNSTIELFAGMQKVFTRSEINPISYKCGN